VSEEKNPTSFNHPKRDILRETDLTGIGQAILTLTKEVWVLTDRLHVMEAILAENGIDISDKIKTYQPDEKLQSELKSENEALIARVLSALANT